MHRSTRREKLLVIRVPGIHSESMGAGNRRWDELVGQRVRKSLLKQAAPQWDGSLSHLELQVSWFAIPGKKDLDNLRLKPVLDALTREGVLA